MSAFSASTAAFFSILGTALIIYGAAMGPTWNIWQINIAPPDISYGLGFAPLMKGGLWQVITICAVGAFGSWALREVEISRKLGNWAARAPSPSRWRSSLMSPWKSSARCSWAPGAMAFPYGIMSHLDWVVEHRL